MTADMSRDLFAEQPFGRLALLKLAVKLGRLPENFRLYRAEWLEDEGKIMKVSGAVFEQARDGNHGELLTFMVPFSRQSVYVTAEEINQFKG